MIIAATVPPDGALSEREVYNIVSDLGTGVNLRRRDNLLQLAAIGVSLFLGVSIGAMVVQDRLLGILAGGVVGVLVGLFGSGVFIMVYRFICHIRGNHR